MKYFINPFLYYQQGSKSLNKTYRFNSVSPSLKNWTRGYKAFSCSTQLTMEFFPLLNVKMPTTVGILTCMSGKNNILGLTEPEKKPKILDIFYSY